MGCFLPNFVFEIKRRMKAINTDDKREVYISVECSLKKRTSKMRAIIPAMDVKKERALNGSKINLFDSSL